jgi:hypothetical protein
MAPMSDEDTRSPASLAMDEAMELNINEQPSPYPDRATFLNADWPGLAEEIARAGDEGRAVVLCYADGTCRILDVRTHSVRVDRLPA